MMIPTKRACVRVGLVGIVGLHAIASPVAASVYVNKNIILYMPGETANMFTMENLGLWPVAWSAMVDAPWISLSDTDPFPIQIGSSQTGKAIGYGTCLQGPIWATSINFFVQNQGQVPCCPYPVIADSQVSSGVIEVVDCYSSVVYGNGATSIVKPDATCLCTSVVPVEETTWGRVKAFYAPGAR